MWCQFGYAFMFSSVFPMASFYALANNLMEMRSDAFKICLSMRRPHPQQADSMGIWQVKFINDDVIIFIRSNNSRMANVSEITVDIQICITAA
jgi:hypothetical protein